MRLHVNISAMYLLIAGISLVPHAAQAQLALTPPCNAASLKGGFSYGLSGYFDGKKTEVVKETGVLSFDGAGHYTRTYTQANDALPQLLTTRSNVAEGSYTITSDCTSGILIFHGSASNSGPNSVPCVFFSMSIQPTQLQIVSPVTSNPPPPAVFAADVALTCTDPSAQVWDPIKQTYQSTYTGTMTQQ